MLSLVPLAPLGNTIIKPHGSCGRQPDLPYLPPLSSGYGRIARNSAPRLADLPNHHRLGIPDENFVIMAAPSRSSVRLGGLVYCRQSP